LIAGNEGFANGFTTVPALDTISARGFSRCTLWLSYRGFGMFVERTTRNSDGHAAVGLEPVLWIAPVMLALLPSAMLAQDDRDVDIDDVVPQLAQQAAVRDPGVYEWVFGRGLGRGTDERMVHQQLADLLRQKVATIDLICELSDGQKQKLAVAGRGDIKRLIDQVERIETRVQLVRQEPAKVHPLMEEALSLKRGLLPWSPEDGSIFDKSLKTILTTEQNARLAALRRLERLGGHVRIEPQESDLTVWLSDTATTDAELANLERLTSLTKLGLASTQVTDTGLVHLQRLTKLEVLDLTGTAVTDSGLPHLAGLSNLQRLDLYGTKVTAAGMTHIAGLTDLRVLVLCDTRVTDPALAALKRLKKLEWLNLQRTNVTDAGLVNLKELANLEWLDLSRTRVSDAGLAHLKEMSSLKWLNLSGTAVTDVALADLRSALPTAKIWKRPAVAAD
jgi:hypothetical protein